MKKLIGCILAIISLLVLLPSCEDSESYADKLKKEKKNIQSFISENKIKVIDEYPEEGRFAENEFFYDKAAGIYINVVDTGNGHRASAVGARSQVHVRYSKVRFLPEVTEYSINDGSGKQPLWFIYGLPTTYSSSVTSSSTYFYVSPALAAPLRYVGENGIVKLIIPFIQGSYYQQYSFYGPVYMGYIQYSSIQ